MRDKIQIKNLIFIDFSFEKEKIEVFNKARNRC